MTEWLGRLQFVPELPGCLIHQIWNLFSIHPSILQPVPISWPHSEDMEKDASAHNLGGVSPNFSDCATWHYHCSHRPSGLLFLILIRE